MRLNLSESPATVPIVDSHLIMNELQQEQKICQQLSSTSYPGSEMPSTTWSSFFRGTKFPGQTKDVRLQQVIHFVKSMHEGINLNYWGTLLMNLAIRQNCLLFSICFVSFLHLYFLL